MTVRKKSGRRQRRNRLYSCNTSYRTVFNFRGNSTDRVSLFASFLPEADFGAAECILR
jgi:hypothetical protein